MSQNVNASEVQRAQWEKNHEELEGYLPHVHLDLNIPSGRSIGDELLAGTEVTVVTAGQDGTDFVIIYDCAFSFWANDAIVAMGVATPSDVTLKTLRPTKWSDLRAIGVENATILVKALLAHPRIHPLPDGSGTLGDGNGHHQTSQ